MIYLITPTGARPNQIRHCAEWMKNQTYKGQVTWIIIDDCLPLTTEFINLGFKENWNIIKVFPKPAWQPGMNTQARNIAAGLARLPACMTNKDIIFIIEDDDYYKPIYLERMIERMGDYKVIGETNTIYYNVTTRHFADNQNKKHASLFQIAFRPDMISTFTSCFKAKFIDCTFFSIVDKSTVNLFHDGTLAIGIKGLSGRDGIGAGHSPAFMGSSDFNFVVLQSLIGSDAEKYKHYYKTLNNTAQTTSNMYHRKSGYPLFKPRRY